MSHNYRSQRPFIAHSLHLPCSSIFHTSLQHSDTLFARSNASVFTVRSRCFRCVDVSRDHFSGRSLNLARSLATLSLSHAISPTVPSLPRPDAFSSALASAAEGGGGGGGRRRLAALQAARRRLALLLGGHAPFSQRGRFVQRRRGKLAVQEGRDDEHWARRR